jgi:hypothetical protein
MSVICDRCGAIVFVSNHKNWTTNKERPEMTLYLSFKYFG